MLCNFNFSFLSVDVVHVRQSTVRNVIERILLLFARLVSYGGQLLCCLPKTRNWLYMHISEICLNSRGVFLAYFVEKSCDVLISRCREYVREVVQGCSSRLAGSIFSGDLVEGVIEHLLKFSEGKTLLNPHSQK